MASVEEIMRKVHHLEIKARRLSRESFSGEYHASFKGQGLDFEDFREYQHGDEIRFIDWNVTARMNAPFIRTFREERELNVLIAVDISGSSVFGSQHLSKRELAAEIAAVLAFSAKHNGDKVGLLLFTSEPVLFLPPQKGTKHTLRIIREILATTPAKRDTSIGTACDFINRTLKRKSLVFMISDFIDHDFHKKLGTLAQKHETIAIRVFDPVEEHLPNVGKINLTDSETGWQTMVNTSNNNVRQAFEKLTKRRLEALQKTLRKYQIDSIDAPTDQDYLPDLHKLFKTRSSRHA
ncbi:hypothetical protein Rhal01_03563 [Rubritalea halochordaticola]|uniref:DUF58 domain-containing protein n=2 Tax=Rubritalea halochordaticola TaxID=714537 RepID=A0ABP9V3X1_9BACT